MQLQNKSCRKTIFALFLILAFATAFIQLRYSLEIQSGGVAIVYDEGIMGGGMVDSRGWNRNNEPTTSGQNRSPACFPHWKVAAPVKGNSINNGANITDHNTNNNPTKLPELIYDNKLPISRLYFYHIRKAGGTMIRKYLKKVALHYNIHLMIQEYKNAGLEEVGSKYDDGGVNQNTIYITNLRDPVERSISHFKYDGRWDCQQLVKNSSFIPTTSNAKSFKLWNQTHGFTTSSCDRPFSFTGCAVNCYIQTYSGKGCTHDNWQTEYNLAVDRLFRYNLILVHEKFRDDGYVQAVEDFFGVKGFGEDSIMFCGPEANEANKKVPLSVGFESVLKLTKLNEMDNRLYKKATDCWDGKGGKYLFPKANATRFSPQQNRTVAE